MDLKKGGRGKATTCYKYNEYNLQFQFR